MTYCKYHLERARKSVYDAIEHLDEARGAYCAEGNTDLSILAAIADHQDDLAEIREKIAMLKRSME